MRRSGSLQVVGLLGYLILLTPPVLGQFCGFLEDYPELQPLESVPGLAWKAPEVDKKYSAVFFDAPEIFLDPDSEYKGMARALQTSSKRTPGV